MKNYLVALFLYIPCLLGSGFAVRVCEASPIPTVVRLTDSDGDGVADEKDRCPNTPAGTVVNSYGCPLSTANCNYSTSTVTLTSTGGSTGEGIHTQYVLATNTGTIVQLASVPTFTGLSGTATYMALAVTYQGNSSNLSVGQSLSAVSGSCLVWSDALVFQVCVPTTTCDYQAGQTISVQSSGGSVGPGIRTQYVLTTAAGVLVQLSNTPSFSSTTLTEGLYTVYAVTYAEDGSIRNLLVNGSNTISMVTGNCVVQSNGVTVRVCGQCLAQCVPIVLKRRRL